MATKKKKVRSHVKRVKLQQKKNPVSQEKYEKRLKVARKKDFFRRLPQRFRNPDTSNRFLCTVCRRQSDAEESDRTDIDRLYAGSKRSG